MKKEILSGILALSMLVGGATVSAADIPESTEISFRVGDSNIQINGEKVNVETPYIAGEGTTLVPLRVITEAFGAEVEWDGETKTITLKYPDVNMVLQIGNLTAKVNDYTQKLDVAPVLSDSGVTMVPLRFISENFGAQVGYDNGLITVVKTAAANETGTIEGGIDKAYIGDSYYGWSMQTPKDMFMRERGFGGAYTAFTDDNKNTFSLKIYANDEEQDFDELFAKMKEAVQGATLIKADKKTDENGNKYFHIQLKLKDTFIDERVYFTEKYQYELISAINVAEDNIQRDKIISLMDSFKLNMTDLSETKDLANLNGTSRRTYENKDFGLKFDLPADWIEVSKTADNIFEFRPLNNELKERYGMRIGVYSKSDTSTAEQLAQKDHDHNSKLYNSKFATISDVESKTVANRKCYVYSMKIDGARYANGTTYDMFFDINDYVYNISIDIGKDDKANTYSTIVNTMELSEPNAEKIGTFLRNDTEDTLITSKGTGWSAKIPASWDVVTQPTINGAQYMTEVMGLVTLSVDSVSYSGNASQVGSQIIEQLQKEGCTVVENGKIEKVNGHSMYRFVVKEKDDEGYVSIGTFYVCNESKKLYIINMFEDELSYGARNSDEFTAFVNSLEF